MWNKFIHSLHISNHKDNSNPFTKVRGLPPQPLSIHVHSREGWHDFSHCVECCLRGVFCEQVLSSPLRIGEEDDEYSMAKSGNEEQAPEQEVNGALNGQTLLVEQDRDPWKEDSENRQQDSPRVHLLLRHLSSLHLIQNGLLNSSSTVDWCCTIPNSNHRTQPKNFTNPPSPIGH